MRSWLIYTVLLASTLLLLTCGPAVARPPVLDAHQVGQYAGKAWGPVDAPVVIEEYSDYQ